MTIRNKTLSVRGKPSDSRFSRTLCKRRRAAVVTIRLSPNVGVDENSAEDDGERTKGSGGDKSREPFPPAGVLKRRVITDVRYDATLSKPATRILGEAIHEAAGSVRRRLPSRLKIDERILDLKAQLHAVTGKNQRGLPQEISK